MSETIKQKAVSSIFWRILEQGGKQGIFFIISVVLARLIMPDQFGLVAMLTVFTAVAGTFIDSGFSTALVRKTDRTQADCSTVYWFNIVISIISYVILFFGAPLVADFYGVAELTAILRVTSLNLVIGSVAGVHRTLLTADMDFKALTKLNIASLIISGATGIILAYMDFKVWALVFQNLTQTVINTLFILFKVKWSPSFIFSRQSFKEFFGFGSKLLASALLDTIYNNVYNIVIGKVYKASDLAYFNRAQSLSNLTASTPTGVLQSVTYPTLCKIQDNEEVLKNGYRKILKISAFVIFPLCLGVGAVAYPLINVLYTDTWIFAATLLSIIVFSMMWYPIHAVNLNYLIVKGKSNLFLRLEIIKKIQGVLILCVTIPLGIKAMCWGMVASSILCLIWNTHYTGKFLKMGILSQLYDLLPIITLSAVMYFSARSLAWYLGDGLDSLICSVLLGASVYIGGALLFKFPEVSELKNLRK
ncbi:MAG: lipopolysaccharide biosynthesis protein [Muribaculaceae bacterium]|nr:lipopolysaccharide biosynthesis protein [Muribaculaceae bacterium]